MKNLIVVFSLLVATNVFSQVKNASASFEVDGVCEMCKKRIEKACITTKGVKSASWDLETHILTVFYNEQKTSLQTIKKNIASSGHDTKDVKAPEDAYDKLDPCCKYRDEEVVKDHE